MQPPQIEIAGESRESKLVTPRSSTPPTRPRPQRAVARKLGGVKRSLLLLDTTRGGTVLYTLILLTTHPSHNTNHHHKNVCIHLYSDSRVRSGTLQSWGVRVRYSWMVVVTLNTESC